ncbi:MAG: hypothetical protein ACI9WC_001633 [Arenicella sp.]|jgi:hypothetical protein
MTKLRSRYSALLVLVALTACVGTPLEQSTANKTDAEQYDYVINELFIEIAKADTTVARDRAAIRAMQGEYRVTYDFRETVVLAANYERYPAKHASAFEIVLLVEESPEKIVLQHILVSNEGAVIKHWRQDWNFKATQHFVFSADQHWEYRVSSSGASDGLWTQCVYEVSDAPRYCGTGSWEHLSFGSTWASDPSWRPLPRREYTVRNDYNVLQAINRHTVTASGWAHEQDNSKVVRKNSQLDSTLVREFGFNDYRRISGFDFSPAYLYWHSTSLYWENVRKAWDRYFERDGFISLATEIHGMPLIEATFGQAAEVQGGGSIPSTNEITMEILSQWVNLRSPDSVLSP